MTSILELVPTGEQLTRREQEVLHEIGQWLTNREIGERLSISEKTLQNTVSSVLGKMGLQRRTQAAVQIAVAEAFGV